MIGWRASVRCSGRRENALCAADLVSRDGQTIPRQCLMGIPDHAGERNRASAAHAVRTAT